jgi:hypothetical protein
MSISSWPWGGLTLQMALAIAGFHRGCDSSVRLWTYLPGLSVFRHFLVLIQMLYRPNSDLS